MKSFVGCLLACTTAAAEEVRIAVGMDYDTAVVNIKRCGGKDITSSKQPKGLRVSGFRWALHDYRIEISTLQNSGKISSLICSNLRSKSRQVVKTLTLNTDSKTHLTEPDDVFVFVIAVHMVPLEGEPRPNALDRASSILTRAGIRHNAESGHGIASIFVEPTRSREAFDLVKKDAAKKGYWTHPAKEFSDQR